MAEIFLKKYYLIFLSTTLGALTTNSLIPLFDVLRENFFLDSIAMISLAISVYIFPFAIFQLFAGTSSDIYDKRKVVIVGFIIFIIGLILCIFSIYLRVFYLFLISFLFLGFGFSFINPTILAILSIITPEKRKGMIMGLYNSTGGIGVSLGSFIAGISSLIEWRLTFLINLLLAITSLILFTIALKDCEALVCRTYDLKNSSSLNETKERSKIVSTILHLKETLNSQILLLGLVGFVGFFIVITLTNTITEQISISLINLGDQEIISLVSIILTINGIISIILSPIWGDFLRKLNPYVMLLIGFFISVVLIFLPLSKSMLEFMVISFIIYIGSSLYWPALFQITMNLNPESKGANSAIINSFRFIGYSMVGVFYLLFGLPFIYIWVLGFNIVAIFIIILLKLKLF